jgi:hypothetical protein
MAESLPEGHRRLVLADPPKPVNEMTVEERNAWAAQLFEALKTQQPHT